MLATSVEYIHHRPINHIPPVNTKLFLLQIVAEKEPEPEKKIARLAIGVEGGFNPDVANKKYEYEEQNSVVILPGFDVLAWPNPDLPEIVGRSTFIENFVYNHNIGMN